MTYTAEDYFRHGVYFSQRGALEQAIREFTRAVQKDPKFVKAYIERGHIYQKRGFFDQAMADFHSALELEPGNEEVRSNLQAAKAAKKETGRKPNADQGNSDAVQKGKMGTFFQKLKAKMGFARRD